MYKSVKTIATVCALAAVISACSSSKKEEEEAARRAAEEAAAAEQARLAEEEAARKAAEDAKAAMMAKCESAGSVFYFDFDQHLLRADARAALLVQAECLQEQNGSIRLEGHADERGSREYNMALGERRANAVRDFLVLQGVSAADIETVSYGEERPVATGSTDSSWEQNRRVELK